MIPVIEKIDFENECFPYLLKQIGGAPKEIFYMGSLPLPEEPAIAIVGTRKATREGLEFARSIAFELARAGFTIISGLALGIDGAAHKGALEAGAKTFAILANGLHAIYPPYHENLAHQILNAGGGLISEYPTGTPSLPHQFLERNRIIAGLSIATLLIEAPIRSGALVTAKHAIEAGREVFVVPGSVRHRNFEGAHMLIRNGARLVRNAKDILDDLGYESGASARTDFNFNSDEERLIFETIKNASESLSVDTLVEITKLEPHVVLQAMALLIISGHAREADNKFSVVS